MASARSGAWKMVKKVAKSALGRAVIVIAIVGALVYGLASSSNENKELRAEQQQLLEEKSQDRSTIRSQTRVGERRQQREEDSSLERDQPSEPRQSAPVQNTSPRERQLERERDRTEAGKERDRRRQDIRERREDIRGGGSTNLDRPRREESSSEGRMPDRMQEFRDQRGSTGSRSSSRRRSSRSSVLPTSGLVLGSDKFMTCDRLPPGVRSRNDVVTFRSKPGNGWILVVAGGNLPSVVMEAGANKAVVLNDGKHMVLPLVPEGSDCFMTPIPGGYTKITLMQFTGSPAMGLTLNGTRVIDGSWSSDDVQGRIFDADIVWSTPTDDEYMTRWLSQYANPTQPS